MGLFFKIVIKKIDVLASLDNGEKVLSASWNVSRTFRISHAHPPDEEPTESVWSQKSEGDSMSHLSPWKEPMGLIPCSQVAAARGVPLLRGPTGIFFVKMTTISSYAASARMSSEERWLWAFKGSDQLLAWYEKAQNRNTSCWRLARWIVLVCWKKSSFQWFFLKKLEGSWTFLTAESIVQIFRSTYNHNCLFCG